MLVVPVLVIVGYFVFKQKSGTYSSESISTNQANTNNNSGNTEKLFTSGFANTPILMSNRLSELGYPVKASYADFNDLIADVKSKNSNVVKIIGEITVGGLKGYEVSINGKAGAWVIKNGILYTYYFDKSTRLTSAEKSILSLLTVGI